MAFVSIAHIVLAVIVVVLVLIQDSKGGGMGAFGGGGGSNSLLGPTGAPSFLAKLTRWVVIGFAITSVVLTNLTSNKGGSALDAVGTATPEGAAPANPATAPQNPAAPTTPPAAETPPATK